MKKNVFLSMALIAMMILSMPAFGQKVNELTAKEKEAGWVLLFN